MKYMKKYDDFLALKITWLRDQVPTWHKTTIHLHRLELGLHERTFLKKSEIREKKSLIINRIITSYYIIYDRYKCRYIYWYKSRGGSESHSNTVLGRFFVTGLDVVQQNPWSKPGVTLKCGRTSAIFRAYFLPRPGLDHGRTGNQG